MPETPQSLLERPAHQPGDVAAWEQFTRLYTPFLQRWSRRLAAPSDADLADIVQNVLAVVVEKLPTFKHNQRRGAFRSWLKTILINVHRGHFRARMPTATAGALARLEDPASDLSLLFEEEHRAHLVRCLVELATQQFPAATLVLFRQVVLEGQSNTEVAARNGVTVNVVNLAKSRVLNWLRREAMGLIDDDAQ